MLCNLTRRAHSIRPCEENRNLCGGTHAARPRTPFQAGAEAKLRMKFFDKLSFKKARGRMLSAPTKGYSPDTSGRSGTGPCGGDGDMEKRAGCFISHGYSASG